MYDEISSNYIKTLIWYVSSFLVPVIFVKILICSPVNPCRDPLALCCYSPFEGYMFINFEEKVWKRSTVIFLRIKVSWTL